MKIVFSQWSKANPSHEVSNRQMAALSNFFARVHGYETILYADKEGRELFKNINYSEVRELPEDILEKFPKNGWSLGKLLTASLMDEQFYHFDFDFLLGSKFTFEQLRKEALFFHHEIWMDKILKNSSFIIKKKPSLLENINHNYRSYNCAVFGGSNLKAIKNAAQNICDFAIENSNFLQTLSSQQEELKNKGLVKFNLFFATILEQLWFPQILLKEGLEISTLISNEETKIYESKDYSLEFDPSNFINQKDLISEDERKTYKEYYNLLDSISNELKCLHFYAQNKSNYKEKIDKVVKIKNIKY